MAPHLVDTKTVFTITVPTCHIAHSFLLPVWSLTYINVPYKITVIVLHYAQLFWQKFRPQLLQWLPNSLTHNNIRLWFTHEHTSYYWLTQWTHNGIVTKIWQCTTRWQLNRQHKLWVTACPGNMNSGEHDTASASSLLQISNYYSVLNQVRTLKHFLRRSWNTPAAGVSLTASIPQLAYMVDGTEQQYVADSCHPSLPMKEPPMEHWKHCQTTVLVMRQNTHPTRWQLWLGTVYHSLRLSTKLPEQTHFSSPVTQHSPLTSHMCNTILSLSSPIV